RRPRQPQLSHGCRAGRAPRDRTRHRAEDPRIPRRARRLPLRRRPRRDSRDRARPRRAAARRGVTVIERSWPTMLVLMAGLGLACANAVRAPAVSVVAIVASAALAASSADARLPACALALLLAGWWWGSLRLDAFEQSGLQPEMRRSASVHGRETLSG